MTDLQLALLAIGAVVVAGVFAYNRIQERRARRDAEAAFRSSAGDALLAASAPTRQVAPMPEGRVATPRPEEAGRLAMPDSRVDYVVDLAFAAPTPADGLRDRWKPFGHLFAKRAILSYSPDGTQWFPLARGNGDSSLALKAGLQLVNREGAIGEAELIEFRAAVDTIAAATGATISATDLRVAVDRARELDRFCKDVDVQVVVHVVSGAGAGFDSGRIHALALAEGLSPGADGQYAARGDGDTILFSVGRRDGGAFAAGKAEGGSDAGLSFMLDVARAPDPRRTFQAMASAARRMAASLEGRLVDDNGHALEEREFSAIELQLDAVKAMFDAQGFDTGSAVALRLFS